ncbi:MAG TPA: efflux RND transporter periplasmic adaptor subunit [Pyrinomonadaceae bacterium]|nr:efflux RND transporter periplasmic adaptor subunit [Pyrinomonadaceae bacterium]
MWRLNTQIFAALVLAILICSLVGCGGNAQTNTPRLVAPAESNALKPLEVKVYDVVPSVASGDLMIPASLSIEGVAITTSRRDGVIAQLTVKEGSHVSKGGMIARLSGDEELRAQLRQAELEIDRLKVEQDQLSALIRLDRSEFDREKTLAKDGLSSQKDVERAQFKFEAATLELEKTKVASQGARAKIDEVKAELERSIISAPISGIVTHLYVEMGSSITKNDKIVEISPTSPLQVKFQVPQPERTRLVPGSGLAISLVDADAVVARAIVRRVEPVADAASNTFGYVAEVVGGKNLMPGLAVNVRVPRSVSGPNFLLPQSVFPATSELRRGTAATVFVIDGTKCAVRSVWINGLEGDQVEIASGLSTGDRIILSPPTQLRAGDLVAAKN